MQNKEKIKILYIDDSPEAALSKYLDEYKYDGCEVIHEQDIIFKKDDSYENLIKLSSVRSANIILIDSKLFENSGTSKLTGEEFKLILRKNLPYIEVMVVTQKVIEDEFVKISKYNPRKYKGTAIEFYRENMAKYLDIAVKNILDVRNSLACLRINPAVEEVLVEKIENSMDGIEYYDELTKKDIDTMVKMFKEIQEVLNV